MNNGLIRNVSPAIEETVRNRIAETEEAINGVKDRQTFAYLKVLLGLKYDYEYVSEYEKADKTAKECLDILFGDSLDISESEKSKMVLSCYDTRARCGDFESFCLALEWNRPLEKQFYIPRRKIFNKFGLIQAFQDVADGKLDFLCINQPPRTGKLLSDDTPVLTRRGWKQHGMLVVGDEVLNHEGDFVKVQKVFPKDYADYEVTFSNGEKIKCHRNHEWLVYDRYVRKNVIRETSYMIGKTIYSESKNRCRFFLPDKQPVQGEYAFLPVDPYTFGAWLGDGTNTNPYITGDKKDYAIVETIQKNGYPLKHTWVHKTTGVCTYAFADLREALQCLGFCHSRFTVEKYIPAQYLTASLSQRLDLLAGLLDTDGCLRKKEHRYSYTTCEEKLKDSFVSLVNTFGWRTSVVECKPRVNKNGIIGKKPYWVISFNPTIEIPCRLQRKKLKDFSKQRRVSIVDIKPLEHKIQGNCIQVEGGIYLAGKQLVPTHNSTTGLFFIVFMACLYPNGSILGNGHSTSLTQSFYKEVLNIFTNPEYRLNEIFPTINLDSNSSEYSWIDLNSSKRFHTMMFKSVDGGTTGLAEASTLLYCDDLVKDVETANNPDRLEKLFYTYTSTIQDRKVQRLCKDGVYRPCPEIHINTPWSIHDVTSRLIQIYGDDGRNPRVRIISVPCYDDNGESNFLYDYGKGFDVDYYKQLEASEDPVIFSAKYLMKPIERDGRPFTEDTLTYYYELPEGEPDRIIAYNDVAHGGEDYMSMPIGYVYGREVYVEDVLFVNQLDDDKTRPLVCQKLIDNRVSKAGFEENNGGKLYADLINEDLKRRNYRCNVTTHKASTRTSKLDRILSCQSEIKGIATEHGTYRLYFKAKSVRQDNKQYNDFMKNLHNWSQKEGSTQKRQHDDAPDSLAGLITNVLNGNSKGKAKSIDVNKWL